MIRSAFALMVLVASLAEGQDPPRDSTACPTANTTADVRRCLSEQLERADSLAAQLAREVRAVTANPARADSAEAAWHEYRRLACATAAAKFAGGSLASVVGLSCRLRFAQQRAAELRELVSPDPVEDTVIWTGRASQVSCSVSVGCRRPFPGSSHQCQIA